MTGPLFFTNIRTIRHYGKGYNIWYQLIHNIFPTNFRLHELQMRVDPYCVFCNQVDDIQHRLTTCPPNNIIWSSFCRLVAIILHTVSHNVQFDQLIRFPEYRYFPPKKRKFLLWLTTHTLDMMIPRPTIDTANCYIESLRFRLLDMSIDQIRHNFDNFYSVLYM